MSLLIYSEVLDGVLQGIRGKNKPLPYEEFDERYAPDFGGRIAKDINTYAGTAFAIIPWLVCRSIRATVYDAPRGALSRVRPYGGYAKEQVLGDLNYGIRETRAAIESLGYIREKVSGVEAATLVTRVHPTSGNLSDVNAKFAHLDSTFEPLLAALRMHYSNAQKVVKRHKGLIKRMDGQSPTDEIGQKLAELQEASIMLFTELQK